MSVRVLLVDDVEDVRRLVRIALRYHGGFDVVGEAQAGRQAIELAAELQPDIVLLDLGLPDLAGREVLSGLRSSAPSARVVVFTGADTEDRDWFEQHTAGYILKDADLDYVVALLEDVGRGATLRASADFDADVRTVPAARELVARTLRDWGMTRTGDAELVVTELATNAVIHAGTPYAVRLSSTRGMLRIEVSDTGPGTPEPQPWSGSSESGRGMVLVSAVSTSWGIDTDADEGKVTWAELRMETA